MYLNTSDYDKLSHICHMTKRRYSCIIYSALASNAKSQTLTPAKRVLVGCLGHVKFVYDVKFAEKILVKIR